MRATCETCGSEGCEEEGCPVERWDADTAALKAWWAAWRAPSPPSSERYELLDLVAAAAIPYWPGRGNSDLGAALSALRAFDAAALTGEQP